MNIGVTELPNANTEKKKARKEVEKEEKKRKKEENSAYDPKSVAGRKNDKKKDDVEVEGQGLMLFEDEEYVPFH